MLIEQAFAGLPEFFCGPLYPPPENEANVAASLMMAVLQEVNGRNASHPLAAVERERLYQKAGFVKVGARDPSYLRADLHVNYGRVGTGTLRLSAYGWRFNNWVEVKYFRNGGRQTTGQGYTEGTRRSGLVAADLVRLACLVPERPGVPSSKGRYLVHVYDDKPQHYVSFDKRKSKGSTTKFHRTWLQDLYKPGLQRLTDFRFANEGKSFKAEVGSLGALELTVGVTNTLITPLEIEVQGKVFWLCLSRIDSVDAELSRHRFSIGVDRTVSEGAEGDFEAIRQHVGTNIGVAEEETEPPVLDVLPPPQADDGENEIGDAEPPDQP